MKKYFGFIFMLLVLGTLFCKAPDIFAASNDSEMGNLVVYLDNKTTNETRFKNGLLRKETLSCYRYKYDNEVPNDEYVYLIVRAVVVYQDANGKQLCCAYFDSTFRYNKKLKLSKCLSTSHGISCNDNRYTIDVEARTKNLALDIGGSYGKVTLSHMGMRKDTCKYIFSCNSEGEISRDILL